MINSLSHKHIFRALSLVTAALTLAACSGDEPIVTPSTGGQSTGERLTLFTAGPEVSAPGAPALKTQIDSEGYFYWTDGDDIFINIDGEQRKTLATNIAHRRQARTDFYVDTLLLGDSYKVRYTGKGNTDPNHVTIASEQTQYWPNDPAHFATSGDCGVAVAAKTTLGSQNYDHSYVFDLSHKAAYMLLLPRTKEPTSSEAAIKLEKIVVRDLDGNPLCGTYAFGDDGLQVGSAANTSSTITLICGDGSGAKFSLNEKVDTALNGAYVVLQPGSHRLDVTYHLSTGAFSVMKATPNGTMDWTYAYDAPSSAITKTLDTYEYSVNKLRRVSHQLDIPTTSSEFVFDMRPSYYMWDAKGPLWLQQSAGGWDWTNIYVDGISYSGGSRSYNYTFEHPDFPHKNNDWYIINRGRAIYKDVSHSTSQNPAEYSAKDMPSANRMIYYLEYGAPRRDNTTYWWMKEFRDGYTLCRGGVWIKKWEKIVEENPSLAGIDPDAQMPITKHGTSDLTTKYPWGNWTYEYANNSASVKQRPALDGLNEEDYFFLPALGVYIDTNMQIDSNNNWKTWDKKTLRYVGGNGFYWSSTHLPTSGAGSTARTNAAYYLQIYNTSIGVNWLEGGKSEGVRRDGMIAGTRPDGTLWFK